ncbi:MAG: ABC transporter substrate-binding protein [Actinomycetales bacterium]|nr:ABC transporter substrate-binding protein [Actinomycetales bacterium]
MKKVIPPVAALAGLALVLTGCSSGGSSASSSSDASGSTSGHVTLEFWHGYTEADGKVLDQIVADFNASQSDITINDTTKTWADIGDQLLTALSAEQGPDLVALPAENLPIYASKGAFASLDDWYSSSEAAASLKENAVSMEKINESYAGVPWGFVPLSVVYNKALFEKAGITEFPTTWDEWVAAAKRLTIDQNGDGTPEQYGLVLPDHATVGNGVWASLFYEGGGELVDKDGKAVVNSDANVQTLTYWADAVINDKISPTGVDGVGADKLFTAGTVAMEVGGPWMASVAEGANIDYGLAPIPAGPAGQASSAIGISVAVTNQADAAKKAAAEKFFDYFYSTEVATKWSLGSGWPPLRTDTPASAVSSNPVVAALTPMASTARPLLPGIANSVDVLAAVDEATQKALAGGDPASLLDAANSAVSDALAP